MMNAAFEWVVTRIATVTKSIRKMKFYKFERSFDKFQLFKSVTCSPRMFTSVIKCIQKCARRIKWCNHLNELQKCRFECCHSQELNQTFGFYLEND